jgi:hypothetical protein
VYAREIQEGGIRFFGGAAEFLAGRVPGIIITS